MDDTASVGSDVVRSNETQVADTLAAAAQALAAISQDSRDSLSSAASAVDGGGGSAQPPTGVATAAHATTHATARTATPSENHQGGGNELGALQRGVKRRRHKTSNVRAPALLQPSRQRLTGVMPVPHFGPAQAHACRRIRPKLGSSCASVPFGCA